MKVKDIMTRNVACCTPDSTLVEAAKMMVDCDCGCIPVVENEENMRLQGIVTDRDMVCRAVAKGMDPNTTAVGHCMTAAPMAVTPETSLSEVERLMERLQVRRIPIVTDTGSCCGIVSQADIALAAPAHILQVVKSISVPNQRAA